MKKSISLILALALLLSLLTFSVSAASASFSLTGGSSVTKGSKINITVKLSGSEKIGSWRFSVNYDPSVLEYVSGADSGGSGALLFSDSSDGVSSFSRVITFRAKSIGSTTLSVSGAQVVSFETVSNMTISGASKKVTVNAAPILSGENNLSDLSLSTEGMTPDFAAGTTTYALTVPFEISSLVISATPKDSKASVSVTGADALVVGENKVDVVVTAENGAKKTYTITVTRQESELAGVSAKVGDTEYQVAYDPAMLEIPEGYEPKTVSFGEKKILTYASPKGTILISYLYNDSQGAWYIFNEKTQSFSPYKILSTLPGSIVLLIPGEDVAVPDGFVPETITIGEQSVEAYAVENSKEANVYLVYGMTSDGTPGFYYYDGNLGTFSQYFVPKTPAGEEQTAEYEALKKNIVKVEKKADQTLIIALAVGILAVILLICLIISLATRKKKTKESDTDAYFAQISEDTKTTDVEEKIEEEAVLETPVVKKRRARRTIEPTVQNPEPEVKEESIEEIFKAEQIVPLEEQIQEENEESEEE